MRLILRYVRRPTVRPPEGLSYLFKPLDFDELRAAVGASSHTTTWIAT